MDKRMITCQQCGQTRFRDPSDHYCAGQSIRLALGLARDALLREGQNEAAKEILAILDQRGCEEFDSGASDGRLTSLMSVIIYG